MAPTEEKEKSRWIEMLELVRLCPAEVNGVPITNSTRFLLVLFALRVDKDDDSTFVSERTLCDEMKCHPKTFDKLVRALKDSELLDAKQMFTDNGQPGPNLWKLNRPLLQSMAGPKQDDSNLLNVITEAEDRGEARIIVSQARRVKTENRLRYLAQEYWIEIIVEREMADSVILLIKPQKPRMEAESVTDEQIAAAAHHQLSTSKPAASGWTPTAPTPVVLGVEIIKPHSNNSAANNTSVATATAVSPSVGSRRGTKDLAKAAKSRRPITPSPGVMENLKALPDIGEKLTRQEVENLTLNLMRKYGEDGALHAISFLPEEARKRAAAKDKKSPAAYLMTCFGNSIRDVWINTFQKQLDKVRSNQTDVVPFGERSDTYAEFLLETLRTSAADEFDIGPVKAEGKQRLVYVTTNPVAAPKKSAPDRFKEGFEYWTRLSNGLED